MTKGINGMQTSIYYIDKIYLENFNTWDNAIDSIIEINKSEYEEQEINNVVFGQGYKTRLFISNAEEYSIKKLIDFYSPIVSNLDRLNNIKKRDISTLLFIYNNHEMFVIPTGYGYFAIQDYLDINFGMKILSGLVDRNENAIKNITERGISGFVMGSTRYYRVNYSFSNEDDFGKLFKEVCAVVPSDVIRSKLGFSNDEVKKDLTCIAKTSFKINKSITIQKLYELLSNISELLNNSEGLFNNLIPILNRGNSRDLNNNLNNELIKCIYDNYKSENFEVEFDICHQEFDKFIKAKDYNFFYNKRKCYEENINSIDSFKFIKDIITKMDASAEANLNDFAQLFKKVSVYSFDDIGQIKTKGSLLKHIQGEFKYNNKTYFIIDGNWFMVEDKFISNINQRCQYQIKRCKCEDESLIEPKWPLESGDEGFFIDLVSRKSSDFIQIHPIKVDNIEICDLIRKCGDKTYLIHVKDGFDYKMRDLTSQIFLAARRLQEMRNSDNYNFLEELYSKVLSKNKTKFATMTTEDFINLFKNNVEFVLAFRDTRAETKESVFEDVSLSQSNIAKYSITNFIREMENAFNFGISIFEIDK